MLITVAVLLSVVASVAVVLVSRNLDRDSNSMDKVRRYADKRIEEGRVFFDQQVKNLNSLSASLDTQQTMAVAAVKKLEDQIAAFENERENFKNQFNEVNSIGQKIEAYGSLLNELMEMTANVEENLVRIKKESGIIDKLNSRISAQEKAVERIDSAIPETINKFEKRNNESLKLIGTELLNQYKDRAQSLEEAATTAEEKTRELLNSIENDIHEAYQQAAAKAQSLAFSMTTIGSVLASLIGGSMFKTSGVRPTMLTATAFAFAGAVIAIGATFIRRKTANNGPSGDRT